MPASLFLNEGRTIGIRRSRSADPPILCGEGCPMCVLASVGLSLPSDDPTSALQKAKAGCDAGAKIITDHSVAGDIPSFHRRLVQELPVPISYLTIYELMARHGSDTRLRMDPHEALDLIEEQAERGVTLITVHATATLEALEAHAGCGRTILTTSRGGAAIANAISHTREQNVYWDHFDDILSIAEKCNITLSLGSTYRPGSICDATLTDPLYWGEIKRMAQLVERAISRRIPIMVEGIGHAPVHRMAEIIGQSKAICHNVPYRVLSVGTDIALGYDHIASAIAITVAGLSGADLATAITAAEHLGQPSLEEVIEGVVAAQIAAHCADLARLGDFSADFNMSQARCRLGCRGLLDYAIYPEGARKALASHRRGIEEQGCAMCGDACALLQSINKTWSDGMDASAS